MNEAAIQGELGSFSHQAARQVFGEDARILACTSFEELFARVNAGEASHGLVPVENTLAGSVTENLDLLTGYPLHVTGETTVRVKLCVLSRPGAGLEDAKRAASHPVALRQCRGFFRSHPWIEHVPVYDTAGSVRDLLTGAPSYDLAIGSALAAELYGADVLLSGIEDDRANFTRFLVVERDAGPRESGPVRTMMAFVVPHRPGSLHRALRVLAEEGLDLTSLESRPIPGKPWEYRFYAGATARSHPDLSRAVERLEQMSVEAEVFGSWHEWGPVEEA